MADREKEDLLRHITAGLVGGGVSLLFFFGLQTTVVLALAMGGAAFVGSLFLSAPRINRLRLISGEVSDEQTLAILGDGCEKIKILRGYKQRIKDFHVRGKLEAICKVADKIYANLARDPRDIKKARHFLSYYMETTMKVVRQYVELSEQATDNPDMRATLKHTEKVIGKMEKAFEKQLDRLLQNDVMDLDTEVKLLEGMMRSEGLDE